MLTNLVETSISLANHQLDQVAVDETADTDDYGGRAVVKELALDFSSADSRNIRLYKTDGITTVKVHEALDETASYYYQALNIYLPAGWRIRLTISMPSAPANCVVNGHVIQRGISVLGE